MLRRSVSKYWQFLTGSDAWGDTTHFWYMVSTSPKMEVFGWWLGCGFHHCSFYPYLGEMIQFPIWHQLRRWFQLLAGSTFGPCSPKLWQRSPVVWGYKDDKIPLCLAGNPVFVAKHCEAGSNLKRWPANKERVHLANKKHDQKSNTTCSLLCFFSMVWNRDWGRISIVVHVSSQSFDCIQTKPSIFQYLSQLSKVYTLCFLVIARIQGCGYLSQVHCPMQSIKKNALAIEINHSCM